MDLREAWKELKLAYEFPVCLSIKLLSSGTELIEQKISGRNSDGNAHNKLLETF